MLRADKPLSAMLCLCDAGATEGRAKSLAKKTAVSVQELSQAQEVNAECAVSVSMNLYEGNGSGQ